MKCDICGDTDSDITCCDICGTTFCDDCGPYREDDAPINLCEACCPMEIQAESRKDV